MLHAGGVPALSRSMKALHCDIVEPWNAAKNNTSSGVTPSRIAQDVLQSSIAALNQAAKAMVATA
jgi:hypothetical protein